MRSSVEGPAPVGRRRLLPVALRWCPSSVAACALLLAACDGPQSALAPAGRGAERIAQLFWWMAGGAAVVWLAVVGLAVVLMRLRPGRHGRGAVLLILGGGVVVPTVVLAILLAFGLREMPPLLAPAPPGSLRIAVTGEQWWWRVRYLRSGGEPVELANEIRLPVGQPVELVLDSPDVIHAFWIPALGGKIDMIPGRVTRLKLEPTRTGRFRGVCAEYCGESHALMAFDVVVMEETAFAAWLERQATPAAAPVELLAARGAELFVAHGCGACHAIRGTSADGVVGPDLTHVGGRLGLAAGTLANDAGTLRAWLGHPDRIKPGVRMPAFGMLPREELTALAVYLEGLE